MKNKNKKVLTKFMKQLKSEGVLVEGVDGKKAVKRFLNPKKKKDDKGEE